MAVLSFCFCLQLDVAIREFDGKFDVLAAVLFTNFPGLFLDEGGKGIEIARDIFSRLLFGGDQSVEQALDLFAVSFIDCGVQGEGLRGDGGRGGCGGCGWDSRAGDAGVLVIRWPPA